DEALACIAVAPVLLVASDYDGTMAPIVADPADARPHRESTVAMRALAQLPQTHVAVISGRALCDLAELTAMPPDVHLVGSHGSEFDIDFATSLSKEASELRRRIQSELEHIAAGGVGFRLEEKPASIAFHYRNARPEDAQIAVQRIAEGVATWEGVSVKRGKMVIELGVVETNKGAALNHIRHIVGASAVVFLG